MSIIVVFNCGSSSIKFALFEDKVNSKCALFSGQIESIGSNQPFYTDSNIGKRNLELNSANKYREALHIVNEMINEQCAGRKITAYAHRVVHGGSLYTSATLITDKVLQDLTELTALAPLHQPYALEAIKILQQTGEKSPHIACFDTAFHSTITKLEHLLPLPYEFYQKGVRRYGFHGLSYEYIAHILVEKYGDKAPDKVIVAHLGSGASLCALRNLRSFATTMGFSALEGLMMGTRTGSIDPGVLLYLFEQENLTTKQVTDILYKKSGLLGISGISNDVRVLLEQEDKNERANLALEFYVNRIVKEIGGLTATLNGLDMLVFTAGVGERSSIMRRRICAKLGYLGMQIDENANNSNDAIISTDSSKVVVGVEATNEEWIAAKNTRDLLVNL